MTELKLKLRIISYIVFITICREILFQNNHSRQGVNRFIRLIHCFARLIKLTSVVIQSRLFLFLILKHFFNTDIDECAVSGSCEKNMLCLNSVGSYSCSCRQGYRTNKTQLSCIGNYQGIVM